MAEKCVLDLSRWERWEQAASPALSAGGYVPHMEVIS